MTITPQHDWPKDAHLTDEDVHDLLELQQDPTLAEPRRAKVAELLANVLLTASAAQRLTGAGVAAAVRVGTTPVDVRGLLRRPDAATWPDETVTAVLRRGNKLATGVWLVNQTACPPTTAVLTALIGEPGDSVSSLPFLMQSVSLEALSAPRYVSVFAGSLASLPDPLDVHRFAMDVGGAHLLRVIRGIYGAASNVVQQHLEDAANVRFGPGHGHLDVLNAMVDAGVEASVPEMLEMAAALAAHPPA